MNFWTKGMYSLVPGRAQGALLPSRVLKFHLKAGMAEAAVQQFLSPSWAMFLRARRGIQIFIKYLHAILKSSAYHWQGTCHNWEALSPVIYLYMLHFFLLFRYSLLFFRYCGFPKRSLCPVCSVEKSHQGAKRLLFNQGMILRAAYGQPIYLRVGLRKVERKVSTLSWCFVHPRISLGFLSLLQSSGFQIQQKQSTK